MITVTGSTFSYRSARGHRLTFNWTKPLLAVVLVIVVLLNQSLLSQVFGYAVVFLLLRMVVMPWLRGIRRRGRGLAR